MSIRILIRTALVALVSGAFAVSSQAEPRTAKIGVEGMVCAFCAQGIEKKLRARGEVERIFVSLENRFVAVSFKDGRTIGDAELGRLIVDSGYKVTAIARVDDSIDEIRASVKAKR